jgi:homoserine kinase type II
VARWHLAARSTSAPRLEPSPGLIRRSQLLSSLTEAEFDRLRGALDSRWGASIAQDLTDILRWVPLLLLPCQRHLAEASQVRFRLQPCIRDIWHDHILFTGETVSGIVDFGAMAVDTVAGDLARLLASLLADDRDGWQRGIEAYQRRAPLEQNEVELLVAFDRANGILSGLNWIRWLFLEDRRFENLPRVAERISRIRSRLRSWVDEAAH